MPSVGAQKRECKQQIREMLKVYAEHHPERAESLMLSFAMTLANTMPLAELQQWQAQLEELDE